MTGDAEFEQARQQAELLAAILSSTAAVAEAELAASGIRPVSVVHGYAETDQDAQLIYGTLPELARECGTLAASRGGNGYTTFLFTGNDADRAAAEFTARTMEIAASWWRITPTAHPVWQP